MNEAHISWFLAPTEVMPEIVQKDYLGLFEESDLDLLDDAKAAITAYNAIVEGDCCTSTLLKPLRVAALSKRRQLWDLASTLIGKLALRFDHAGELILSLGKEKGWNSRFTALCCITKNTPRPLMLKVIGEAINDRSGEVRWKAAQQAEVFRLKELIRQIEIELPKERNIKIQESLQSSLGLLRTGYLARVDQDGMLNLTVRLSGEGWSGDRFPKGKWENRNLGELADEVREKIERANALPTSADRSC